MRIIPCRVDEDTAAAESVTARAPGNAPAVRITAASYSWQEDERGSNAIARLRKIDPDLRVSNLA